MLSHLQLVAVNLARLPIQAVVHMLLHTVTALHTATACHAHTQSQIVWMCPPLHLQSPASLSGRLFGLQSDAFNPVEDPDSFDDMYACDRSAIFFSHPVCIVT